MYQIGRGYLIKEWSESQIDITNRFAEPKYIGFDTQIVQEDRLYFWEFWSSIENIMGVAILSGSGLRVK